VPANSAGVVYLERPFMSDLASRIDAGVLRAIAPPAKRSGYSAKQVAIMDALGPLLPNMLRRFEVTTPLRIGHFLSQLGHESDAFKTLEEYASGAAYEGRDDLGNKRPGDGKRYKGRGPIQLTGRSNYRSFTSWLRGLLSDCPDFEQEPELVATFPWAAWAAIWFWSTRRLNILADRDDLVAVTKVINGGRNGLADRAAYLARAKTALARLAASGAALNALHRGDKGEDVEQLQRQLAERGFYRQAIDADFGPATENAVKAFQAAKGLAVDGIAGNRTFDALEASQ